MVPIVLLSILFLVNSKLKVGFVKKKAVLERFHISFYT